MTGSHQPAQTSSRIPLVGKGVLLKAGIRGMYHSQKCNLRNYRKKLQADLKPEPVWETVCLGN